MFPSSKRFATRLVYLFFKQSQHFMTSIAIVGAGLSGLTAASLLNAYAEVTVFDKSRGYGGRIATRYSKPFHFDYGAQYIKAKSKAFQHFLAPMIEVGVVKRWDANFVEIKNRQITHKRVWDDRFPHYVGVPEMAAIGEYLQEGLDVRLKTCVKNLSYMGQYWYLTDDKGNDLGRYNWVIVAIPAAKAAALVPSILPMNKQIKKVRMQPCFALMLGFEHPLALPFDAAVVVDEDISWISVNNAKPGRNANFTMLVKSTNPWAAAHINDDRKTVMKHLREQTTEVIGYELTHAEHQALHRWDYANADKQVGQQYLFDQTMQIAVCGDWLIQGRAESAFLSGHAAATNLLACIGPQSRSLDAYAA